MKAIISSLLIVALVLPGLAEAAGGGAQPKVEDAPFNVEDPWLKRLQSLTYDKKPDRPVPGVDYGMEEESGTFQHPKYTPMVTGPTEFQRTARLLGG